MELEIDRPLIDARNIRPPATQTVTADGQLLIHNNRNILLVTLTGAGVVRQCGAGVQAIQDGSAIGHTLTIMVVDDGAANWLRIISNLAVSKTYLRGNWLSARTESATTYNTYLTVRWNGTYWKELERYDGYGWSATGDVAHAEGFNTQATNSYTHAEGSDSDATGYIAHAEGWDCLADGGVAHAQGYQSIASLVAEHAQAAGGFAGRGDAQFSRVIFRSVAAGTTDATLTEIFLDGVDDLLTILDEYTYACTITVVGRQDTGADNFMGKYHALIQRTGGAAPALVGAVDSYENNPGGWGAGGGLPVSILAGATNLEVWVEGLAAHNIRWVAVIEMVRVHFED